MTVRFAAHMESVSTPMTVRVINTLVDYIVNLSSALEFFRTTPQCVVAMGPATNQILVSVRKNTLESIVL